MDTVAEPTEAVDNLPSSEDGMSFSNSLDAAFAKLDGASAEPQAHDEPTDQAEPEAQEEPTDQAEPEAQDEQSETSEGESETENPESSDDPLEALSEDIGDDWTPKAANRFKELKAELKTNRAELEQFQQKEAEYRSKIEELTGLTENKDFETLQEKLAEYEWQQALTDLEKTSAYDEAVGQPLASLMEQADILADKYGVNEDTLTEVLAMDDPTKQEEAIAELFPEASDRDKAKIFRIIDEIDPILERRKELYENADAALAEAKQLEESQRAVEAAEQAKLRKNVTKNVVERVQQKLPFLKGIEGVDFESIEKAASETDPSVLHPVDHAYNNVSAQLFPTVIRQYLQAQKEIESLTDRLAEFEDIEPSTSGQTKSSSGAPLSDDMSFEQRVSAALGAI